MRGNLLSFPLLLNSVCFVDRDNLRYRSQHNSRRRVEHHREVRRSGRIALFRGWQRSIQLQDSNSCPPQGLMLCSGRVVCVDVFSRLRFRQGSRRHDAFSPQSKRGWMPLDSGSIFPVAGSVLVCGREQLLL
jgi:hypothetical protein